jgi:hypothetical protein
VNLWLRPSQDFSYKYRLYQHESSTAEHISGQSGKGKKQRKKIPICMSNFTERYEVMAYHRPNGWIVTWQQATSL